MEIITTRGELGIHKRIDQNKCGGLPNCPVQSFLLGEDQKELNYPDILRRAEADPRLDVDVRATNDLMSDRVQNAFHAWCIPCGEGKLSVDIITRESIRLLELVGDRKTSPV